MNRRQKQLVGIAAIVLGWVAMAGACTIPVFRYALDRWPADPYGLAVDDKWARSDAGEKLLKDLGGLAYRLQFVPAEKPAGEVDLLLPARGAVPIWSGPADAAVLKSLAMSPARRQIAAGILAGNSAVWIVVRGNDAARNREFEARLEKRLKYLESVAAIPPQDPFDPESRLGPGPELRVGFKTIAVDRDDAAEQMLIKMVAGPAGDGLLESGEPFAGPVFGRGRVLGAFTDEQLDEEGIDELCLFLLGACSCQVKAQNPGWDLLVDTDWDTELTGVAMAALKAEPESASPKESASSSKMAPENADDVAAPEMVVFSGPAEKPATNPVLASAAPARELVMGMGLLALAVIWLGWKSGN